MGKDTTKKTAQPVGNGGQAGKAESRPPKKRTAPGHPAAQGEPKPKLAGKAGEKACPAGEKPRPAGEKTRPAGEKPRPVGGKPAARTEQTAGKQNGTQKRTSQQRSSPRRAFSSTPGMFFSIHRYLVPEK